MLLAITAVVCAQCHPAIVRDYLRTPMGQSAGLVRATSGQAGQFRQQASGLTFTVRRSGEGLEMRAGAARMTLQLYIGSGRHGRSYAEVDRGFIYQAPVGYYASYGWDMAPGYQNDSEPDINRPVAPECLECHAAGVRFEKSFVNKLANWRDITGIGCERCHGDGEAHATHPLRTNIVNPPRLSGAARRSVCERCHLSGEARIPLPGRRIEEFRAGDRLSEFLDVYVHEETDPGLAVNSHADALSRSKCRLASGEPLWCGTCHSVHRQATNYRSTCVECHEQTACQNRVDGDCVTCHMPKARTYDGNHTVFTDHTIPRVPRAGVTAAKRSHLKRYYDDARSPALLARNLGLAFAAVAEKTNNREWQDAAWALLRDAVQTMPGDPMVLTEAAWLLQQTGHSSEASRLYRESLRLNPNQNAALANLAGLSARAGDNREALQLLERALRMNPRQALLRKTIEAQMGNLPHD